MLEGVLTRQSQGITSRNRETQHVLRLPDGAADTGMYLAVDAFQMRLLGEFVLLLNDTPVSGLDVPRLRSLLAYLALHRGLPQARSRIAYTLWPDSTDAQAHTNLRNLLFKLRMTLPEIDSFLVVERQTLCWQSDAPCSLDVTDFERAVASAEYARDSRDAAAERLALEKAVRCYQGDLLPGCYDEWLCGERERLQQTYQGTLERLVELLEQEGSVAEAIRMAQRLLRIDPLQEATYRSLMRLHAVHHDRSAVMRTYQTCAALLKCELGIAPGSKTRRAFEQLMQVDE